MTTTNNNKTAATPTAAIKAVVVFQSSPIIHLPFVPHS
jgi:hypothetical protein